MPERKEILITGHPRSGTKYAASLFCVNGKAIGHEMMAKHGISAWIYAVRPKEPIFTFDESRRQDYEFDTVIHIMREPLSAIASIVLTEAYSEPYRAKFIPVEGNEWERGVLSYARWNKLIQTQMPDMTIATETMAERLMFTQVRKHNQREHRDVLYPELITYLNPSVKKELDECIDFYNLLLYNPIKKPGFDTRALREKR